MLVASGQSPIETTSRAELLAALAAEPRISTPSRVRTSYRTVMRLEVEAMVRTLHVEAVRAEREAAAVAVAVAMVVQGADGSASKGGVEPPVVVSVHPVDGDVDVSNVALTPKAMALAFQRLVALDQQALLENHETPSVHATTDQATSPHGARVFLLVDYPATTVEARTLLITGAAGQKKPHQTSPDIPLLPLIDGVLLVVDSTRELRERRKSISQPDKRRDSATTRASAEAQDATVTDKALPLVTSSVFQSANPFVKELYETAAVGGLEWSDFVFVDLTCSKSADEVKPPAELLIDLEMSMGPLLARKAQFKAWVSTIKTIDLPSMDFASENALRTTRIYQDLLHSVFEPSITVAAVVLALREAVARGSGDAAEDIKDDNNQSAPEAFLDHGDEAARCLALRYDLFLQRPSDDTNPCYVDGWRIDDAEKTLWRNSDLPGVGNHGRKAMPVHSRLSEAERSVLDTEISSFAAMPVARVHLTRQLLRLEELLGQQWKGKLRTRDMVESLHEDVLPQRIAAILRENPMVVKEYDEATDSLLFAAITATAPGRFRTTTWTAQDHVRHRPVLKDWSPDAPPSDEYLTPRTALAATACVPLSAGELSAVADKCTIAYPADQSIIKLHQTPHAPAWLSVSLDGDIFGFRPRSHGGDAVEFKQLFAMHFYLNLVDGCQVLVHEGSERPKKPDGHGSITASLTTVEGVIATVCSDGTTILKRHQSAEASQVETTEKQRVIWGKGVVVCAMSDGSRRILLPNGDVVKRGALETTVDLLAEIQREHTVDPETNALVEMRPATGVVVVTHTDGSRVTYHTDGTTMFATATRSHILIRKSGLPDVCVDIDVNLAAQRHSNGEKVAVTKGGLRTRCVVRFADGTEMHNQYNTKVVAEVNGRIVVEKPDGTRVVAKDSGRIEFTTRRTVREVPRQPESSDDMDRDELSQNSVYYFNCRDGSFSLVDSEQNHLYADIGDGCGSATMSVELAGVLSGKDAEKYDVEPIPARAVINDPIEPFLMVLHGDGTGLELLRPRDALDYVNLSSQPGTSISEVAQAKPPSSQSAAATEWWTQSAQWIVERTFLDEVRPDATRVAVSQRKWFHDDKISLCFQRLEDVVATAFSLLGEQSLPPPSIPEPQFTVVRRLQQLRPQNNDHAQAMLATLNKWRQWQDAREANKDQFKVVDQRDAEVIAQEVAMQRKVLAAYKATRARKKAERQKLREQQRKSRLENGNGSGPSQMETVQEGKSQDGGPADDDGDDFDNAFSEGSDEDCPSDIEVEVDDPDELMWAAFCQVEVDRAGRLTLAQARQALVNVLGYGVTSVELAIQLRAYKQPEPFAISFDVFVDIVHAFREELSSGNQSASVQGDAKWGTKNISVDTLKKNAPAIAVGSATEAVRSVSSLKLNPSSPKDLGKL